MGYYTDYLLHQPNGMSEDEFEQLHNTLKSTSNYEWSDDWVETTDGDTVLALIPDEGSIKWYVFKIR